MQQLTKSRTINGAALDTRKAFMKDLLASGTKAENDDGCYY
jgi:hypothetical protein